MNINKKLVKGTAITAAAVTLIATAGINMVNAADTDHLGVDKNNVTTVADNTAVNVKADGTAFKDETVYVMADASGATKNIIVSDWLKNFNASAGLSDFSTLSNLVNVKGDETFDQNSNQVTWNANGNDIYYQGNSEAELPVNVKVTYTLDGVEMPASELIGKSGKLTVRYDYTNTLKHTADINGKTEDIYTPLVMITGTVLPTDKYRNVEVTNGKVISDGNSQMVVGIALPGLTDSLKTESDQLDIPEFFEYTADVTEYEASAAVSVGLTDILSGMDINGTDFDLDDIQSKVDELVDGVDKLADGSSKLYDGTGTLADATSKFCDGTSTLYDGTDKLLDGSSKLADGSNTLYDGINTLASKTGDFKKGVTTLSSSLTTLKDALTKLQTGVKTLDDGAGSLVTGADTLHKGIGTAKDGMDQLVGNYSKVTDGANQLASGADTLAAGAGKLQGSLESVNGTYATLSETVANDQALIEALKKVNAQYKDENIAGIIAKMEANTAGQKKIADGLTAAGGQLVEGAKNLNTGAASLKTGANTLAGGVKALSDGSVAVQGGLTKLYAGSSDLLDGAKKLSKGTASLVKNVDKLAGAGVQLETGAGKLVSATDQFAGGISKLQTGSGTLKDGLGTLRDSVGTLKDGAGTLKDNAVTLNSGANDLKDGAGTLKDGIQTLQNDGIGKITDLINGDLNNVIERFKAIVDESKAYKNYSGIGDDMDGSVKFIIKYED